MSSPWAPPPGRPDGHPAGGTGWQPPPPSWSPATAGASPRWPPATPPWMLPPHATPQPYHGILRTRTYHWARPLLGLVVFVAAMAATALVLGVAYVVADIAGADIPLDDEITPTSLLIINLSLAALIPATMLAVVAAHRLRPGWLGSVTGRLRWRLFLPFGAIALVVTLGSFGVSLLLPADDASATEVATTTWQQWSAYAVVVLLTSPLQAAGEEYLFRGYLLQVLGAWLRVAWVGILITSFLFALAHGAQNPALFTDRFAFGLLAGWLVWRTGGLEAAIAFHAVNNVVIFLIASAFDQVSDSLNVSDIPWSYAALDVASMAVLGVLVELYLRRRPVRRLTDAAA